MRSQDISATDFTPEGSHRRLWSYWRSLQTAAGTLVPPRSAFKPSKLIDILPTLALSEYIDDYTQLIRVIGGGHDSFWPKEAIGSNLFDYVDSETAEIRRRLYHEVMTRPCGCFLDEVAITSRGRRMRYKGLFLPLLNSAGEPKIFIGSYDFTADGYEMEQASSEGIVSRSTEDILLIDLAP